jgi:hypothetical protein
MSAYEGNLFKITMMRIPKGQGFEEPLSAVNGNVEGSEFCFGMIHTRKDGCNWFIAASEGAVIAEGDDIEPVAQQALDLAKGRLALSDGELSELLPILCIDEDADYDLDEVRWQYSVGNCGEVRLGPSFAGGVIINVTPYYKATISLEGKWGEATGDADCAEGHEFCGAFAGFVEIGGNCGGNPEDKTRKLQKLLNEVRDRITTTSDLPNLIALLNTDMQTYTVWRDDEALESELDYCLEALLEHAASLLSCHKEEFMASLVGCGIDIDDFQNLIYDNYLQLEYCPGGGVPYEIKVRASKLLSECSKATGESIDSLIELIESDDWHDRMWGAYAIRSIYPKKSKKLLAALKDDEFEDDNGYFLVREAAGFD